MNLKVIKLSVDSKDRTYFEQVNEEAFPDSERLDFDEIFQFASKTDTDVLGIYDTETPIGFAVILKNTECGYIYFLAIDKELRSQGYGGATIQKLMEIYPERQLVLDFEEIDESAENNAQRVRRKNFYLKNGFYETGYCTMLYDEYFEVVCSEAELRKTALQELLCILHKHRPEFPNVLVSR